MRVTIVPDDGTVGVEGEFLKVDLSGIDPNIHAVQWYGDDGEVEFRDHRTNKKITSIEPFQAFVDAWFATLPPPPSNTPQAVADRRKSEVDGLREQKFVSGYAHTDGATYNADIDARLNIVSVVAGIAAGKGLPAGRVTIGYRDGANTKHDFSESQFLDFSAALRDWVSAVYETAGEHKDALDAIAVDLALTEQQRRDAIAAYDITVDWPV